MNENLIYQMIPTIFSLHQILTHLLLLSEDSAIHFFCRILQASGGPGNVQLALWRQYPGTRLVCYLHYGAVIWMPSFTHSPSV